MVARHARGTAAGGARARSRAIAVLLFGLVSAAAAEAAPPEHTLFGLPYYSTGAIEGFAQLIALLAFAFALLRHRRLHGWTYLRRVAVTTLLIVAIWEAAWNADVLFTSLRMAYLCHTQGGLQVYRTAEADGFMGYGSVERETHRGFEYIERLNFGSEPNYIRETFREGKVIREPVAEARSGYWYVGHFRKRHGYAIKRSGERIIDVKDDSVMGELVTWEIYPGLFDRTWLSMLPAAWKPWTCSKGAPEGVGTFEPETGEWKYPPFYLLDVVLQPKSRANSS